MDYALGHEGILVPYRLEENEINTQAQPGSFGWAKLAGPGHFFGAGRAAFPLWSHARTAWQPERLKSDQG